MVKKKFVYRNKKYVLSVKDNQNPKLTQINWYKDGCRQHNKGKVWISAFFLYAFQK